MNVCTFVLLSFSEAANVNMLTDWMNNENSIHQTCYFTIVAIASWGQNACILPWFLKMYANLTDNGQRPPWYRWLLARDFFLSRRSTFSRTDCLGKITCKQSWYFLEKWSVINVYILTSYIHNSAQNRRNYSFDFFSHSSYLHTNFLLAWCRIYVWLLNNMQS